MPDRDRIAILVVDDHALFRESVARLLSHEADFAVVATVGSIDEALEVLNRKAVDLVLLDFDLGGRDGLDFLQQARPDDGGFKVLVVTAGIEPAEAGELIRAGVSGIFLKRDSADHLVAAIRDAHEGSVSFDQELFRQAMAETAPGGARRGRFTHRERQVLSGVFEGLANKEIAGRIGVSESSVKGTLQQLFTKTGVRTRSQLVRITLERYRQDLE
jgi:two-component system, NarL family, nitrate/nitrite response regulator NarL